MKYTGVALAILVAMQLTSCATSRTVYVTPPIETGKAPTPKLGYVAASTITDDKHRPSSGVSLGLVNTATQAEYLLPIGSLGFAEIFKDLNNAPRIIAIPPGQYRVAFWVTHYGETGTCELQARSFFPTTSTNSITVSVKPNSITFVGSYSISSDIRSNGSTMTTKWGLKQNPISERDARNSITYVHPDFLKLDFFCPSCTIEPIPR